MVILRSPRRVRRKPLHTLFLLSLFLLLAMGRATLARAQQEQAPHSAQSGNCTHPDPATRPDCPGAIAFLTKFQNALKRNDRDAIASLINYPLLAIPDRRIHIRSRTQLLANFDRVFNPLVRAAILKANADNVWGNSHGFMVGNGVIWFDSVIPRNNHPDPSAPDYWTRYPFKVITVNPPIP